MTYHWRWWFTLALLGRPWESWKLKGGTQILDLNSMWLSFKGKSTLFQTILQNDHKMKYEYWEKNLNYLEKKIPKICHCGNDDAQKMGVQTFYPKIISILRFYKTYKTINIRRSIRVHYKLLDLYISHNVLLGKMRVFFLVMKENSFQEHVAFGKTITFNPNFTIVLWQVQHKLYYFYKCWKFPPKESFSTEQFIS